MYKSIDFYLNRDQNLFIKKSKPNIYTLFSLDKVMLKKDKYRNFKIEFHLHYSKGAIYFVRYISYKNGRTIFSCIKEMVKFLNEWNVDWMGHFVVFVEDQI